MIKHNYIPVNLQLFASNDDEDEILDDEEVEDVEESEDIDDADDEENPDENEDVEEEEEEEIEEDVKVDKKTHAIIKAKQKAKKVNDENKLLKAELDKLRQAEQLREDAKRRQDIEKQYIDEGYHEETAKKLAAQDFRLEQLEKRTIHSQYERQAERLEGRFPEVWGKLNEFINICEKTGWNLEKVCKAELEESSPVHTKIKDEQAEVLRRKSSIKNKPVSSSSSKMSAIKLSAEDEAAYKVYAQFNPGVSKKQYKERILDARNKDYEI